MTGVAMLPFCSFGKRVSGGDEKEKIFDDHIGHQLTLKIYMTFFEHIHSTQYLYIMNNDKQQLVENFGNFKILENVTPSDSKVFGFACVSGSADRYIWGWSYEVGSFDFIYGYYRGSLFAHEHRKIACMAMFVLNDDNIPVGIISSLYLTQEESRGLFSSSEPNAKVVMRDLILSNIDFEISDFEGLCDFNDR